MRIRDVRLVQSEERLAVLPTKPKYRLLARCFGTSAMIFVHVLHIFLVISVTVADL